MTSIEILKLRIYWSFKLFYEFLYFMHEISAQIFNIWLWKMHFDTLLWILPCFITNKLSCHLIVVFDKLNAVPKFKVSPHVKRQTQFDSQLLLEPNKNKYWTSIVILICRLKNCANFYFDLSQISSLVNENHLTVS